MIEAVKELVAKNGADVDTVRIAMALLDVLPTDLVVDQLVENFQNEINNGADPDLTPDEREWMFDFYGTSAFRELLMEMINAFGMEQTIDMIAKVGMDESNDIAYLMTICDEDPEYIATVYANEIADLYLH